MFVVRGLELYYYIR